MTDEPNGSSPVEQLADPGFAKRFAALVLACWFSHDGQWFLKAKDRWDLPTAMALNEQVAEAMGKIHARRVRELVGLGPVDDCVQLAHVLPLLHPLFFLSACDGFASLEPFQDAFRGVSGLAPGVVRIVCADPDQLEFDFPRCILADMAHSASIDAPAGALPGCRGLTRWIRGLGRGLSARYDFVHEERAGEPAGTPVCRHRITRVLRPR